MTGWCAPRQPAPGAGLAAAVVSGVQKLQVFDITPPPPPRVTEYQVQARECGRCGVVTAGAPPAGVTGRAQYGPEVHAQAASLASAHHVPVARAVQLMGDLAGVRVSAGFMAGVIYADETPARAGTGLHYVHVACTEFLTAMHTGDRTKQASSTP